jgi:hypothetical protein
MIGCERILEEPSHHRDTEAQRGLRPQSKIPDSRFKKRIGAPVDNLWVENQCSCGFYASLRKKLAQKKNLRTCNTENGTERKGAFLCVFVPMW